MHCVLVVLIMRMILKYALLYIVFPLLFLVLRELFHGLKFVHALMLHVFITTSL
jgi:hypothetical protein